MKSMTKKIDVGKVIYRPFIATIFRKFARVFHVLATIFFFVYFLLAALYFNNHSRALILFVIFLLDLLLIIFYAKGVLTICQNGFDRNISPFLERVLRQPRYFKINEINMIYKMEVRYEQVLC